MDISRGVDVEYYERLESQKELEDARHHECAARDAWAYRTPCGFCQKDYRKCGMLLAIAARRLNRCPFCSAKLLAPAHVFECKKRSSGRSFAYALGVY